MGRIMSLLTACTLIFILVPTQVLGAGNGAEEAAHGEPSGLLLMALTILSILTLIIMIVFSFRDNG
ncbi:hypothetical protein ACFFHM_06770 [Halalkalibacter kiskunsagensis]|uniref:Preprotein translocase subunit SecG n=1 Tax=Halalkalibacter kiskunsagensis TaxID=1548599 RepID=A0ABV6KEH5_9BACI